MPLHAAHIIVHGRVQGVGFRFFVRQQAVSLDISGWVRNLPDGTVEIHAEGEHELVKDFISAVGDGPVFGYVSEIKVDRINPTNKYTGFAITF